MHGSCSQRKDPKQDCAAPCRCLDDATVPQGQQHLAQAKAALQAPLTAAKGPIDQTQDQGRANHLHRWLYRYP